MPDLTEQDLLRMQADAARRVREMQRRSQFYTNPPPQTGPPPQTEQAANPPPQPNPQSQTNPPPHTNPPPQTEPSAKAPPEPAQTPPTSGGLGSLNNLLSSFLPGGIKLDHDRILLLGLLFLLWKEGGDLRLLLALFYLLW